jgi:hypothetical protein
METSEEQLVRIVDDYASELRNLRDGTWTADDAIAADMDEIPDMFEQWMYFADPMETVIITRTSFGRPETSRVSAVEMLVGFGGPDVRITFHEYGTATVSGQWGRNDETRNVDMGTFGRDIVERFSDMFAMSMSGWGGDGR